MEKRKKSLRQDHSRLAENAKENKLKKRKLIINKLGILAGIKSLLSFSPLASQRKNMTRIKTRMEAKSMPGSGLRAI